MPVRHASGPAYGSSTGRTAVDKEDQVMGRSGENQNRSIFMS